MFSVIVTTQDSAVGLKRTLRSVRSQLYPPQEVLVVDRGNSSDAEVICNEFRRRSNLPLTYLRRPGLGRGAAYNLGIATASGKYLTFLAAQDELLPFALEQYCQHFQQQAEVDVCYGRYILRDRAGKLAPSYDKRLPNGDLLERLFRGDLVIQTSAFACSRRTIEAGHRFPTHAHGLEPQEFLLRLAAAYCFHCVQEDVVIVENRQSEQLPELATLRTMLWERLAIEFGGRIAAASIAEGLAKLDHVAAAAWWKAGNSHQAQQHIERAMTRLPRRLRFWWLASLIHSQKLLRRRGTPIPDAA